MVRWKPLRTTRQRQVVLEELKKLSSHPTAAQLYEIARRRLPKISLGTVYRNLELLAANGMIQKLEIGSGEAHFDGRPDRHYHVRCVRCERVEDVPDLPADFAKELVDRLDGYEILGVHLTFTGICPDCRGRSAPRNTGGTLGDGDRA